MKSLLWAHSYTIHHVYRDVGKIISILKFKCMSKTEQTQIILVADIVKCWPNIHQECHIQPTDRHWLWPHINAPIYVHDFKENSSRETASGKGPDGSDSVRAVPFPFAYLANKMVKWSLLSGFWKRFPYLKKKKIYFKKMHRKKSLGDFPFLMCYLDKKQPLQP